MLGDDALTFAELGRRFESGERLVASEAAAATVWSAGTPLFVVTAGDALRVAGDGRDPVVAPGDTVIALVAGGEAGDGAARPGQVAAGA